MTDYSGIERQIEALRVLRERWQQSDDLETRLSGELMQSNTYQRLAEAREATHALWREMHDVEMRLARAGIVVEWPQHEEGQ